MNRKPEARARWLASQGVSPSCHYFTPTRATGESFLPMITRARFNVGARPLSLVPFVYPVLCLHAMRGAAFGTHLEQLFSVDTLPATG